MGIKSKLIKPFAKHISKEIYKWASNAVEIQKQEFKSLLETGKITSFGKEHQFQKINSWQAFREQVPIRDYESLKPYIQRIIEGEQNVLWKGRPKYFAKTSGTTSGSKYIPITRESIPNHINTARNALFNYYAKTGKGSVFDGKMIFLSGSPELELLGGIPTGRLSGISNHFVPSWLKTNQLPSYKTNCIEDWEEKVERIVDETLNSDMRLISGIPPWVQMYYERLLERSGKETIRQLFPDFSLFVHGGVNFEPYRAKLEELTGTGLDQLETYPASEGFIAFQDDDIEKGLLLNVRSGIYYEFVPSTEIHNDQPARFSIDQVETGVNYAVIINNNAGLWAYNLGDTIKFVSLDPPRIIVTGRVKHFISAFGEHVIGKEVEQSILEALKKIRAKVSEFTVAPQINPPEGELPYHEWFIEFDEAPANLEILENEINNNLVEQNIYYRDLIDGKVLQALKIRPLVKGAFRSYMRSVGKLGGQNKVSRLSNDRKIADQLTQYISS